MKAVNIGLDPSVQGDEMRAFNQVPQDMLRALPGVNEKNMITLTLDVENIQELANMEEADLIKLVGTEAGRRIHRFFNQSVYDNSAAANLGIV